MVIKLSRSIHLEWAAENQVCYHGLFGEVTIKEKVQKILHRYDTELKEIIHQDFPHGVNTASVIAVYSQTGDDKLLLQDKSTSTTFLLSSDCREILDSWHHEGILITCLSRNKPVYAVEKTSGEYEIVIVDDNKDRSETRLRPVTTKPTWSHPYLSACEDIGKIAVTSNDHTLDIYHQKGR